ncbi:UPF0562 protein C7orf55-like protein [Leptotrombidium deliense]|uniref:Protein FMC1 homolog n=1 Tax=Leptotrombidium deliense TaxID=299467 RepID=A0A443S7G1_9ACAR|nr:UPF0562 protein C7orf55-like protein [Leptotrombidium deliense]
MASIPVSKPAISVLRCISHEIRRSTAQKNVVNNPSLRFLVNEYRKYETTDERVCKPKREMHFIAETILCYLNSTREARALHQKYYGKGERSVEETAKLLGFEIKKGQPF